MLLFGFDYVFVWFCEGVFIVVCFVRVRLFDVVLWRFFFYGFFLDVYGSECWLLDVWWCS